MFKNILITQLGELQTNCYIIYCEKTKHCAIIDPGAEAQKIERKIDSLKLIPKYIALTHGHYDHIGAVPHLMQRYQNDGILLAAHEEEIAMLVNPTINYSAMFGTGISLKAPDVIFKNGDILEISEFLKLLVIHTPGHTSGGSCFIYDDKALFSGDTLFLESVGRTDLYGGSFDALSNSIKKNIFTLNEDIIVFPGHGPHTSIGHEKRNNSYV